MSTKWLFIRYFQLKLKARSAGFREERKTAKANQKPSRPSDGQRRSGSSLFIPFFQELLDFGKAYLLNKLIVAHCLVLFSQLFLKSP